MFHYFFLGDRKQYSSTNTSHIKRLIELSKEIKVLASSLSTIWGNTDGFVEQYRCASSLYLISVMSQCYSVIIDHGKNSPGHDKEVVNGINAIDKMYILNMSNVQLLG